MAICGGLAIICALAVYILLRKLKYDSEREHGKTNRPPYFD